MPGRLAAAASLALAALVFVPAALADGPMPYASQGGMGVVGAGDRDGPTRYVAVAANGGANTVLEAIRTKDGVVWNTHPLDGAWGIPMVTYDQGGAGLTVDGKTLVLGDADSAYPHDSSRFLVFDTKRFQAVRTIALKGDFAFDAISPDGRKLYLIQHVDPRDSTHYVVREYDVAAGRLLPQRIADRTQKGWVMQGSPMARASSADGRWVYTLYTNPGGYPFVHALDTVRGVAHCIGLPWHGSQNGFYNLRLALRNHERLLAVHWLSGRPWLRLDTRTWRVTADHGAGFPWLLTGGGCAVALLLGLGLLQRRRRSGQELEEELRELLRVPEREVMV
jgi:hypothetical protein